MLVVVLWVLLCLLLFGLGFSLGVGYRKRIGRSNLKLELRECSPEENACELCCMTPTDCRSVCCSYARRMYPSEYCDANWRLFYLTKK